AAKRNPQILKTLDNPFALTPGFTGPAQPEDSKAVRDDVAGGWAAPFVMATINTKNVHRSSFLRGQAYGADFVYDEMMLTGDGKKGENRAKTVAFGSSASDVLLGFAPTRALIRQFALPKPGQ